MDAALGDLSPEHAPFRSWTMMSDTCALLTPAGVGPAGEVESPTVEDLAQLPLIALEGWGFASNLEAWFAAQGIAPSFVLSAENQATLRAFVRVGLGSAIVPRLDVDRHDPSVDVVDLGDLVPSRRVALCWHASRPTLPALETFREVAVRASAELSRKQGGEEC